MLKLAFMMNIMFLNSNNPLILSLIIFFQIIFISLILGSIYFSFWFSYMIFLIFIGGLLILFLYIISLIYNKKFNFFKNKNLFILIIIIIVIKMPIISKINIDSLKIFNFMNEENLLNLIKLYNFHNNLINLMIISYLFYLMVIVVKISNFLKGPFRYF